MSRSPYTPPRQPDFIPPPGSSAAMQRGCRCSAVENCYGRGIDNGYTLAHQVATYIVADNCPLHQKEVSSACDQST